MQSQVARSCPAGLPQQTEASCEGKLRNHESAEKAGLQTEGQKDGADAQTQIERPFTSNGRRETEKEKNLHNCLLGLVMPTLSHALVYPDPIINSAFQSTLSFF